MRKLEKTPQVTGVPLETLKDRSWSDAYGVDGGPAAGARGRRDGKPGLKPPVEKPIVILDDSVDRDRGRPTPKGTDLSNLANKNLSDPDVVVDAYGVGGGAGGAGGQRFGRGRVVSYGGGVATSNDGGFVYEPEHSFKQAEGEGLRSTFSIDVDTASYSNVRRFLSRNTLPVANLVRVEELINYFSYAYAPPAGDEPFAVHTEVAGCPWAPESRLVRIGLKGRVLAAGERPPCNLVFLIDVSGSMQQTNKLPLLKQSLRLLVKELGERDTISIVTYAGASGLVLPPTSCSKPEVILSALGRLSAGGSTNGGAGIQLAYRTAIQSFVPDGVNRVVLATDGDWNVGVRDRNDLEQQIAAKAKSGVFLSVLGFGLPTGDRRMETLADKGNGNYASIDVLREAHKALVTDLQGTLVTIAKDVKIQVEFDPKQVASYRLIGYENRALANTDFANDAKDAGEIGAGHSVTALYEVVPAAGATSESSLLQLRLRYKQPEGETSQLIERGLTDSGASFAAASPEFRFASAVAAFGMLLRGSEHKGSASYGSVLDWVGPCLGADRFGYRAEFVELVQRAQALSAPVNTKAADGDDAGDDRG